MDKLVTTRRERFWWPEAYERDQFVRAQAAQLPAGSRVLDAGAGASKYRPFFAHCRYETQDFCQYTGPLVKYLQPVDHVCDITRIPLPDQSLDAILCTEVFEHVTDPMAAVAEFARLLKPGGRLLLTTPMGMWLHMEPYHFYGGLTPYWYEHWLARSGLRVDQLTTQGGPGRGAASNLAILYMCWWKAEQQMRPLRKAASFALRMLFKLPTHYLLPWFAQRIDPYLDRYQLCTGIMVAATRVDARDPEAAKSRADWQRGRTPQGAA